MPKWTTRTVTTTTIEVDGIEVELETEPESGTDVTFVQQSDKLVVAYRTHDADCGNPLAEQDGDGMIHWHPNSKHGRTCGNDYLKLLNIDQYGNKVIDEDKLQQAWHDKIMALPLKLFQDVLDAGEDFVVDAKKLRELLANENIVGDYYMYSMTKSAWGLDTSDMSAIYDAVTAIENTLEWNYEYEGEKCWKGPEKGVVMLDCYEHSGISLSVAGSGMQCQWDTSSGAAVWAPDSCAMDEIDRRAAVYAFCEISERRDGWMAEWASGSDATLYPSWGDVFTAARKRVLEAGVEPTPEQLALGIERAAEEICESALEQYNAWANGDCWNVWSQRFELVGEKWVEVDGIGAEVCGGYVGTDWAEQEMRERLHFNHWPEKEKAA